MKSLLVLHTDLKFPLYSLPNDFDHGCCFPSARRTMNYGKLSLTQRKSHSLSLGVIQTSVKEL